MFVKKKHLTYWLLCYIILEVVKQNNFTGGVFLEKIVRQSLLYDFYGELLTEHQKSIYEDIVMNDLSYSEIARLNGISRQGVYDMIKRCDKILEGYESKLKLVEKFVNARNKIADIQESIEVLKTKNQDEQLGSMIIDIEEKTSKILEDF